MPRSAAQVDPQGNPSESAWASVPSAARPRAGVGAKPLPSKVSNRQSRDGQSRDGQSLPRAPARESEIRPKTIGGAWKLGHRAESGTPSRILGPRPSSAAEKRPAAAGIHPVRLPLRPHSAGTRPAVAAGRLATIPESTPALRSARNENPKPPGRAAKPPEAPAESSTSGGVCRRSRDSASRGDTAAEDALRDAHPEGSVTALRRQANGVVYPPESSKTRASKPARISGTGAAPHLVSAPPGGLRAARPSSGPASPSPALRNPAAAPLAQKLPISARRSSPPSPRPVPSRSGLAAQPATSSRAAKARTVPTLGAAGRPAAGPAARQTAVRAALGSTPLAASRKSVLLQAGRPAQRGSEASAARPFPGAARGTTPASRPGAKCGDAARAATGSAAGLGHGRGVRTAVALPTQGLPPSFASASEL